MMPTTTLPFAKTINHVGEVIDKNPYYDSLFKEVAGTNLPKMSLAAWFGTKVGNFNELREQSIMQLGNTAYVFMGGMAYDWLLNKGFKALVPNLEHRLKTDSNVADLHKIGKSLALYGMIAPFMMTIPNLRNWYTIKTTGATNFVEMSFQQKDAQGKPVIDKAQQEQADSLAQKNMNQFLKWNAVGLGGGLAGAAASVGGIHAGVKLPEWFKKADTEIANLIDLKPLKQVINATLTKPLLKLDIVGKPQPNSIFLKDGKFMNFAGAAITLSWIYTGYGGYFLGQRDPVEKTENIVNAAVAVLSFSFLSNVMKQVLNKTLPEQGIAGIHKNNVATLAAMGIGTTVYGLLPMGLSMLTRKNRAQKAGLLPSNGQAQEELALEPLNNKHTVEVKHADALLNVLSQGASANSVLPRQTISALNSTLPTPMIEAPVRLEPTDASEKRAKLLETMPSLQHHLLWN